VSLGNSGVVWPWLAVWLPNVLFVPVAYVFYRFAQQ
jgi:lipopolysaccharide export LptBFGC system permease protein LptF